LREWIGWWSPAVIALVLSSMSVNPLRSSPACSSPRPKAWFIDRMVLL
jgi:hypothetical protein